MAPPRPAASLVNVRPAAGQQQGRLPNGGTRNLTDKQARYANGRRRRAFRGLAGDWRGWCVVVVVSTIAFDDIRPHCGCRRGTQSASLVCVRRVCMASAATSVASSAQHLRNQSDSDANDGHHHRDWARPQRGACARAKMAERFGDHDAMPSRCFADVCVCVDGDFDEM